MADCSNTNQVLYPGPDRCLTWLALHQQCAHTATSSICLILYCSYCNTVTRSFSMCHFIFTRSGAQDFVVFFCFFLASECKLEKMWCFSVSLSSLSFLSPSGEVGFRAMSETLGWAKRPMLHRIHLLPPSMPVTMLYGAESWMDSSSGDRVAEIRGQAYTRVQVSRHRILHTEIHTCNLCLIKRPKCKVQTWINGLN